MPLSPRQMKIVFLILAIFVVLAILIWLGFRPPGKEAPTLVFWSLFDSPQVFDELITQYAQETGVNIKYVLKDESNYEKELIDALASGQGPDILIINNNWLLKHSSKLQPAPAELLSAQTVEELFPQVVAHDFVSGNFVYAIPLSIDTLALFYNRDLFDQATIPFPPTTWEELLSDVPRLAKISKAGIIERAAIALGTSNNVVNAADILSLLMMQVGAKMVDEKTLEVSFHKLGGGGISPGAEALQFYTRFAQASDRIYTWNRDLPSSIDAFARGDLAMFIGYARDISRLRERAPYLDFKVAVMPQAATAAFRTDYANYWGYGVSRTSRYPREAWEFISWLAELPQSRAYMRRGNLPPARRELIREVLDERILGVFARQALTAQTWYQSDPEAVSAIFKDMITDINLGRSTPQEGVTEAADQINLLFRRFR